MAYCEKLNPNLHYIRGITVRKSVQRAAGPSSAAWRLGSGQPSSEETSRQVSLVVTHIAIDAGGLKFDSRAGQIGQRLTTAETLLHSCVVKAKAAEMAPPLVTRFGILTRVQ